VFPAWIFLRLCAARRRLDGAKPARSGGGGVSIHDGSEARPAFVLARRSSAVVEGGSDRRLGTDAARGKREQSTGSGIRCLGLHPIGALSIADRRAKRGCARM